MENAERPLSKSSIGEAGDVDNYGEETKQERLDRFSAAAWSQSNGPDAIPEETRNITPEDTQMSAADMSQEQDAIEAQRRAQRLHASSMATVTGAARDSQLSEFVWPVDVNCATAEDVGGVAPDEKPRLKKKLTKLANKESHPLEHIGITLGLPMIVACDLVIPCIIYYTWFLKHKANWKRDCKTFHDRGAQCPIELPQFDEDIMGTAVAMFGIGEAYVLLARVWRLFFRRDQCAPLLSRSRWEFDATSWVYLVAMLIALIPFVTGASLVLPELYLYGPSFLMAFLGTLMVVTTLIPIKIPIGINSHERGTRIRPFIYYAAEDFIAVDGLQDREFRVRYNQRYETSKAFRRMFVLLTLWWELGVAVYIGCVSAVIWVLPFHIAFGLSLGVLFSYIATWAAGSYVYVNWEMNRQRKKFEEGKSNV